jgi:hypothetical protein
MPRGSSFGFVLVALAFGACGGAPAPQPVSTEPKPAAVETKLPPPVEPSPPADAGTPDAGEPPPAAAPTAAPEPEKPTRTQKPIAMLTARDAAFLVDYANSAAKQKAQAACETESKGDAEKQGACLTKAREKFQPDVLRFRRDSETKTSLIVYKRNGATLKEIWIGGVELSEPSDDTVKVKFVGSQKGARPLWRGKAEVTISVPNEYSIEVDDSEHGKLRYDAKIGLVTQ